MQIDKTRTTVFTGPGSLEVREIELPALTPSQVLVKTQACGLCTWEQRFYKGTEPESYPFRGGHEVSGVVVEVGSEAVCEASASDRVSLAIKTRCGSCYYCRRGMDNFCANDDGGHLPDQPWGPGGLSDYVIVEGYQVYKASPERSFTELALAEPVACVIRSVCVPPLAFGDTVVVQGVGVMGLLHVLLLKHQGLQVIVAEPDEERRRQALSSGADLVCDPLNGDLKEAVGEITADRGVNAVFFTAGGERAIQQALPLLDKGAWLCLYGSVHPNEPVEVDPNFIHYNELVVTGTFSHTKSSFRRAVAMLSQGQLDTAPFISEQVPFPDVTRGFERAISSDTYRVVMTFDEA
ncbi:MAG: D-arabitol-phosphate dehydrogenase [Anaerolineales bacterium]|nr:D-arabitol-phosphate dehydrogenase [Anaerolineales bacterium]